MQSPTFLKRQKELKRQEKQRDKQAKRAERALAKKNGTAEADTDTPPLDAPNVPAEGVVPEGKKDSA